ncbi:MAG TPA: hypothetical protein DHW02_02670 [Ktedonobacter sp.]|nr:hypothetical protein [Ktedonobacter sp.]
MRGKLRDKRTKYDGFKREALERKRPGKRETRMAILLDHELEEQNLGLEEIQEPEDSASDAAVQKLIRITKLTQK